MNNFQKSFLWEFGAPVKLRDCDDVVNVDCGTSPALIRRRDLMHNMNIISVHPLSWLYWHSVHVSIFKSVYLEKFVMVHWGFVFDG